jgi:hypothetical protein
MRVFGRLGAERRQVTAIDLGDKTAFVFAAAITAASAFL